MKTAVRTCKDAGKIAGQLFEPQPQAQSLRQAAPRGWVAGWCGLILSWSFTISQALAQGYGPGCPWPTPALEVLPSTTPLLSAAVRWCGLMEAPTMVDPNLYTCRPDPKFAMWGRHERASDGILIPQAKITMRSGALGGHPNFKIFADPDTTVGVPGDVVIVPTTEIDSIWNNCDQLWGGPSPQPKGVMVISAYHLLNRMGAEIGLGFGIVGSVTRPYIVVADVDVGRELNERALAYWFCRVLNVTPDMLPGSLMNRMELTGVTLATSQCNEARAYLSANPILDPPAELTDGLARVASTFDEPGEAARPFLDIGKILTTDASPVRGDLTFCLGTRGPLPTGMSNVTYWILLDRDNNPETGAVPDDLVPGTPMRGVDFVGEVRLQGTNITANLYERSEFGFFVPIVLGPGLITGAIREARYEIIEPFPDYQGPVEFPAFAEIDFRVAYSGLGPSGLGNPGVLAAAQGREGLFPNGLRIQTVAEMPGVNSFDMAPNEGAVQRFPRIDFPTISLPAQVKRGERMVVTVGLMPPNVRLKCLLGPQMLSIDAFTDEQGTARFAAVIPMDAVGGPRLVTVGVDDVENAITADGMVIVESAGSLRIARLENKARLSWQGSNSVLQSTGELPGHWSDVEEQPSTLDGVNFDLTVPAQEKREFFRLRLRD